MLDTDVAWAAGFFDGEGSVTGRIASWQGRSNLDLRLQVGQVKPEPLEKFLALFGGHLYLQKAQHKGWSDIYRWWVGGSARVQPVLVSMLPYLTVKRPQAEVGIELCSLNIGGILGQDKLRVGHLMSALTELNRRGVPIIG